MNKDLLLEIGTEEIPAKFMSGVLRQLSQLAQELFTKERIGYREIQTFGTPRRLALIIRDMSDSQDNKHSENRGPSVKIAFTEDGTPSKAAQGFARGQGVDVKDLIVKDGYVYAVKKEKGALTADKLPQLLPEIISALNFPKSMRWGNEEVRFVRPIRWLLALFGSEIIRFSYAGLETGNKTRGHRFLSKGEIEVQSVDDYFVKLAENFVMVDQEVRSGVIKEQIQNLALELGGTAEIDEDLLEEVTYLVEYPTALYGKFEEKFLTLPKEAVITPMREHQRYFPVFDKQGNLLPVFITVRNGGSEHIDIVQHGNERVLRARLADAEFFFLEDRKHELADRVAQLKTIVFQEGLGSLYDKTLRLQKLAVEIAKQTNAPAEVYSIAERSAFLAKADLVTAMVCEFTELQGVMGREYALLSGEAPEVATAIYEHYLPRFSGDALPSTPAGIAVGIADKIDNITATFSRGLIPTGSQDPFALRRQALGIINIILQAKIDIKLTSILAMAMELLNVPESDRENLLTSILEFINGRFKGVLTDEGIRYDVIDAVLVERDGIYNNWLKAHALAQELNSDYMQKLLAAFSRAGNLADKAESVEVQANLFADEAERALYQAINVAKQELEKLTNQKKYVDSIRTLAGLSDPIDAFFDSVMVMVDDLNVRNNRLALLKQVTELTTYIGDVRKIVSM